MLDKPGIWTTLALCATLAAGCGGGDKSSKDSGSPTAASSGSTAASSDPAVAEIRTLAETYLHSLASKDFKAACATRSSQDVQALAKQLGSCEKAYRTITAGKPVSLYSDAKAGAVRIKGDVAGVDITAPQNAGANTKLAAIRENGQWRLRDLPDAQIP